jgi:hypothetical protein
LNDELTFRLWSSRLMEALEQRGLKGVPQGYWVRPAPETLRYRIWHGWIIAGERRRGPANKAKPCKSTA